MLAALTFALLAVIQPIDPGRTTPSSCLSSVSAESDIPPFGVGLNAVLKSAAGEYVACEVDAGRVEEITVTELGLGIATLKNGTRVEFNLRTSEAAWITAHAAEKGVRLVTSAAPELKNSKASTTSSNSPSRAGLVALVLSATLGGVLFWRWHRERRSRVRVGGSSTSTGKPSDVPDTRFSDVAGCKEAIEDLAEIVDVLQHPDRYERLGARAPKGALLVGPPGTGKTLLARAVAGEAGVPFFSAAGSDFVEMYVGVGARRVRDVFQKAKKAERAIVFIDEIDAVGRARREAAVSGGEQESENTLIALLNELDGFRGSNVVVLGATNRPDVLDPALVRPGRLDRRIHVGLPDVNERREILSVHLRNKPLDPDVVLETIAARTPGMSGAQLEQVCNEAALVAARLDSKLISISNLHEAVEYVVMGRARRSARITESDRLVTAWHEAGHTIAALKQPNAARPVAVSIIPRGQAGGVTWMEGTDDQMLSRSALKAQLVVALAGRAAEELLLADDYTAGAAHDLVQATRIAHAMVERFGMTDHGLSVKRNSRGTESAVDGILAEARAEALKLLEANRVFLEALVRALLERENLTGEEIVALEATVSVPTA
jgi:cell division protease FtsH